MLPLAMRGHHRPAPTTGFLAMTRLAASAPEPDPAVYSRADMARLLDVSERQVDRLVADGTVPGVLRLGRLVKFRKAIVDHWLREQPGEKN